jgi:hypothetical protein
MYISRHMQDLPRLSWLNAKQYKHHFDSRKNRPGCSWEQKEAVLENARLTLEKLNSSPALPALPDLPVVHVSGLTANERGYCGNSSCMDCGVN